MIWNKSEFTSAIPLKSFGAICTQWSPQNWGHPSTSPPRGANLVRHRRLESVHDQREHRRERSAVRDALATGSEPPHPKGFGDPWDGDKDGKRYVTGDQAAVLRN